MKYFIWVFALCYINTSQAQSCCTSQLCSTNTSADIIEDLNYLSRVGIAYGFISDQFALISKINESNSLRYHNQYQHLTLSGRLGITKSFFVQLSLPYKFNKINADNQISFYNGLGDIKVGLGGTIWKAQNSHHAHVLELSADVQIPSGRYYTNDNSLWNSVVISPGTGAFAYNINLNYRLRHKHIIFSKTLSVNQSFVNQASDAHCQIFTSSSNYPGTRVRHEVVSQFFRFLNEVIRATIKGNREIFKQQASKNACS